MKTQSPRAKSRRANHRGQTLGDEGFNLVVLAMAIMVLNVMVAAALPAWSKIIQREKEAELIFRGLQYAEAVRVFQLRQNRLPVQLRELIEVEPRAIRKLWQNPMADDGAWYLLPVQTGQSLQTLNPQGGNPQGNNPQGNNPRGGRPVQRADQPGQRPNRVRVVPPVPGEVSFSNPQAAMPFIGVSSPDGETASKIFMGSNEIKDWRFSVETVKAMRRTQHEAFARPVHSGVFWRPFPPDVNVPGQQSGPTVGGDPSFNNPPGGNPGNRNPGQRNDQ